MNRIVTYLITAAAITAALAPDCLAQRKKKQSREPIVMGYEIIGRDTVYYDEITPSVINGSRRRGQGRDWILYYKRVHNFSKAYPYALFVARVINETDSLFAAGNYNKRQQSRYLNDLKEDLLKEFEPIFRTLTLKQGLMMIRLIDREVGKTPYIILKEYLGGGTAGFWQGVAKLLKGNLKQPYEKEGQDEDLEELVNIWHRGDFDRLYLSIFGKPRPEIYIPERFR